MRTAPGVCGPFCLQTSGQTRTRGPPYWLIISWSSAPASHQQRKEEDEKEKKKKKKKLSQLRAVAGGRLHRTFVRALFASVYRRWCPTLQTEQHLKETGTSWSADIELAAVLILYGCRAVIMPPMSEYLLVHQLSCHLSLLQA